MFVARDVADMITMDGSEPVIHHHSITVAIIISATK